MTDDTDPAALFQVFNEIGIIAQLSSTLFEARLPSGFLVSHFSVLNHLVRVRNGATPLQLAQSFQVAKTTMTHTLAGLQKHGLVALEPNPQDARSKQVWLTDAGRAFREAAIGALKPDLEALEAVLSQGLAERLLPDLRELRCELDERRLQDRTV